MHPAAPDPEPQAHIGILLVHGIGDHKEGETLTAFGEPLLDWMRDWLHGGGGRKRRGVLTVEQARLTTDGAPAYALAEVTVEAPEPSSEKWLVCEGWWGGSVQAPPSWNLLLWMWSRTPLLVYWHFYLIGVARGYSTETPRVLFGLVPAFLLASIGQLAVSIAMVLWLIPIGPWRQGLLAMVRALTLTLGDSYVLIGQEIQHAALVERVRRALAWLAERTDHVVVVAHSQGGAIAHEALLDGAPAKVSRFISLGSGLEKLQFLRKVIDQPSGAVASALIFPGCLLTFVMARIAWNGDASWQTGLAWVSAAFVFVVSTITYVALGRCREQACDAVSGLTPPPAGIKWLDLFATRDAVPMGRGSLLKDTTFVTQSPVFNEGSFLRDHLTYFTNDNDCLHRIWQSIATQSRLNLFEGDDDARLERFSRLHVRFGRVFAFSRLTCILATFILAVLLRHELMGFGQSVLAAVKDTAVEDWLKPVRAVAGFAARLVNRWWPGTVSEDALTQSLFGLALLLGAIVFWWSSFRAFWLWRRHRRWRAVARGSDVQQTAAWRAIRAVNLCLFGLLGSVPLIVAVVIAVGPDLLTFESMGHLVAGIFSLLLLLYAFFFAAAGPFVDAVQQKSSRGSRFVSSVFAPLLALAMLAGARKLWPSPLPPDMVGWFFSSLLVLIGLAWQLYAVWKKGQALGPLMTWLVALVPPAVAAMSTFVLEGRRTVVYVGTTAVLIGSAFLWHHRRDLKQVGREVRKAFSTKDL